MLLLSYRSLFNREDLDGRGSGKDLGGVEREESVMRKYYMRKKFIFNKRKKEKKRKRFCVFFFIKCDLPKELEHTGHLPHIYRGSFDTESQD